jgi:hypothetical protein
VLGALFPPNGRYALLVALTPSLDLFICAKDLFVEAKPLTWLHKQHSGAEGFSLPGAAQPGERRRINSRDRRRLGQSDMGGDHAQTVLESHHTRWPSLSISVCIAGSRKDVQELYQLCKHESGKDFCLGYISGVADHMLLNGAFLRSHGKEFKEGDRDLLTDLSACLKTTGSFEGVVQTFITWFESTLTSGT